MTDKIKIGWMGPGDYFVGRGHTYLGRVSKTSRKWEAWAGVRGVNTGIEFPTRRAAVAYLVEHYAA